MRFFRQPVGQIVVTTGKLRPERRRKLEELARRHSLAVVRCGVVWEPVVPASEGQERESRSAVDILPFVRGRAAV